MNIKIVFKNQKGIGLVEVIAALGVSVIAITALVSLALFTMRSSLQSKLTLEAAKMATRESEMVRAYRDRSTWADFLTGTSPCTISPGTGVCNMNLTTLIPTSGTTTETIDNQVLTRRFTIDVDNADNNIVYVTVTVSWNAGGSLGTRQTNIYTTLTNWRHE